MGRISKHVNIIFCSDSPSKVSHLSAINEALQGKIRLLENRIARLQDDVETNNLVNANTNNGMTAIMMSRPKKSRDSKPVIFKKIKKKILILFLITAHEITALALGKAKEMSCLAKEIPSGCVAKYGGDN